MVKIGFFLWNKWNEVWFGPIFIIKKSKTKSKFWFFLILLWTGSQAKMNRLKYINSSCFGQFYSCNMLWLSINSQLFIIFIFNFSHIPLLLYYQILFIIPYGWTHVYVSICIYRERVGLSWVWGMELLVRSNPTRLKRKGKLNSLRRPHKFPLVYSVAQAKLLLVRTSGLL